MDWLVTFYDFGRGVIAAITTTHETEHAAYEVGNKYHGYLNSLGYIIKEMEVTQIEQDMFKFIRTYGQTRLELTNNEDLPSDINDEAIKNLSYVYLDDFMVWIKTQDESYDQRDGIIIQYMLRHCKHG